MTDLLSLPDAELLLVFQHLGALDVCRLARSCRTLATLLLDHTLWRGFVARDWGRTAERALIVLGGKAPACPRELFRLLFESCWTGSVGSNMGPADWGVPTHPGPSGGQLGLPMSGVRSVVVGGHHSLFVDCFDRLYSFGSNSFGQLGSGDRASRQQPTVAVEGVRDAAAGYAFSMCVLRSGRVMSCGFAKNGRCAVRSDTVRDHSEDRFPLLLCWTEASVFRTLGLAVQQLACGSGHALALCANGGVYSWGRNDRAQCGIDARAAEVTVDFEVGVESPPDAHVPLRVPLPGVVVQRVYAGAYFSLCLSTNATQLLGWGAHAAPGHGLARAPVAWDLHGARVQAVDTLGPCVATSTGMLLSQSNFRAVPIPRNVVALALPHTFVTYEGDSWNGWSRTLDAVSSGNHTLTLRLR